MESGRVILQVRALQKSFGGVRAVDGVDLSVPEGGVYSVIGPNGSGKTTLFNVITGFHQLDGGTVIFKGEDITGLSAEVISRKGISRAFQRTSFFRRLSALENVRISALSRAGKRWDIFSVARKLATEEALGILDAVGLYAQAERTADTLAHGDQRRLELGICLAAQPTLVLLDEPTSGVSPEETQALVELIRKLSKERGLTVVLIEHDMDVVFSVSQRIIVMHQGKFIAEGNPEDIRQNEEVQMIYLGEQR